MRPAWAEVDLAAVRHNVAALAQRAAPARFCAVVKADGYGHGAVQVGRAALAAGADWLAVALMEEGIALRDADVAAPILVLSEPRREDFPDLVAAGLTPTVYTAGGIEAAAAAAMEHGQSVDVHLKVNTGMHRVGASPDDLVSLAGKVVGEPSLTLAAVWTHCAVADEPGNPFTAEQLRRFDSAVQAVRDAGIAVPLRHAANSAATLDHPDGHYDLVRCGIGVYGINPSPALAGRVDLRPALSLKARVSHVHCVPAGVAVSYGLRRPMSAPTMVATVPIGYADGVRRGLFDAGGQVLIGGQRRPYAGAVTMDQILVDCGDDESVRPGDEVVLIGTQGDGAVSAEDWAAWLGTIAYEVVCGIGPRVPRVYLNGEAST